MTVAVYTVSCTRETIQEAEKTSQLPTGIVLIEYPTAIVKGDTASIRFRINPSAITLKAEDFRIDALSETFYDYFDPNKDSTSATKSSYVTDPADISIVSLKPNVRAAGDTLTGEWIMQIAVGGDSTANYIDKTHIALVLNYQDNTGAPQMISSQVMEVLVIPTIRQGITIWNKSTYTYLGFGSKATPKAYISIDAHQYQRRDDDKDLLHYSLLDYVSDIKVSIPDEYANVFTVKTVNEKENNAYIELTPNLSNPKWTELQDSKDSIMMVPVTLSVTDINSNTLTDSVKIVYYAQNELTISIDASSKKGTYSYDLTEQLGALGYIKEELATLKRNSFLSAVCCNSFILRFQISTEWDASMTMVLYKDLVPGTVYYDPDNLYILFSLDVFPNIDTTSITQKTLDFKIPLRITVTE